MKNIKRYILSLCAMLATTSLFSQNYQVVVTTTDGESKVFATNDVSDIKFNNAPAYIKADTFIGGTYTAKTGNAVYNFSIGTEEPDGEGDPSVIGGLQLGLNMYAPLSADAQKAVLPEGYYRVGPGESSYTVTTSNSAVWVRQAEGSEGIVVGYIAGGTVDVRHVDDNYDIRAELDLINGTHVDISFFGRMNFTPSAAGSDEFKTDQNVTFTAAQGREWANWFNPFCDDGSLEFFTGSFNEKGRQTEGYYLYMPVNITKDDSHTPTWEPVILDGEYKIDPREKVMRRTYLPYTLDLGHMMDDPFGSSLVVGSYLTYLAVDGRISMALITDGTMTVTENGTKFAFNFTASNGIKITGTYDKRPYIVNMIDNSKMPEFPDNLTSDYKIDKFPEDGVVLAYNIGDYIVKELNSHILMFTDPKQKKGDYISLDLFSDSDKLKDGVYTIDNSITNMSGIKGVVNYQGEMVFSWYGDLDSTDDEGYQTILAPISGGTLTVTTIAGDKRKFDFNLRSRKGHKIIGSITRDVHYVSPEDSKEDKVESIRARALKGIKRNWGSRDLDFTPRVLMQRK